jgi:hypothetical protein
VCTANATSVNRSARAGVVVVVVVVVVVGMMVGMFGCSGRVIRVSMVMRLLLLFCVDVQRQVRVLRAENHLSKGVLQHTLSQHSSGAVVNDMRHTQRRCFRGVCSNNELLFSVG